MAYRTELEKGSKKHICPRCGHKRFVREVYISTGEYVDESVGRCDRANSCDYSFSETEFRAMNFSGEVRVCSRLRNFRKPFQNRLFAYREAEVKKPDYIPKEFLFELLDGYEQNIFVNFLLKLFPEQIVEQAVIDYSIGTYKDFCVFPKITFDGKLANAKLMKFDAETGKRLKNDPFSIWSLPAKLQKFGKLKNDFQSDTSCFFGEHLTTKKTKKVIAVVESEKTAILCSILMPEKVWLASGSRSFIKTEKLRKFRGREIVLYPDGDGFDLWSETARLARLDGLNVKTSAVIEKNATEEEKRNGIDLADLLLSEIKSGKIETQNLQTQVVLPISVTVTEIKNPILEFIKRLQSSGVKFHLSPEYFETDGRVLSLSEREKMQTNAGAILCQLQQAALEKKIFKSFPEIRKEFVFQVLEREAILAEADEPNAEYKAIRQTAFIWFHGFFHQGELN